MRSPKQPNHTSPKLPWRESNDYIKYVDGWRRKPVTPDVDEVADE